MSTKNLSEIISEGKQLAHSIYEERNAVLTDPDANHDVVSQLLDTHDEIVTRFAELETLLVPDEPEKKTKSTKQTKSASATRDLVVYYMPEDWTISDLANAAGVSTSTINNLISGESKPRRGTLAKVEAALGLQEGDLDG